MDKLHVDYAQYHQLIDQVIHAVRACVFQPDVIVGVSRGGLFLADGLSRSLKVPMAVVVASSYRDGAGTQQGSLRLSTSIASLVPLAGKVLLADDLADSGGTLSALVAHLKCQCPDIAQIKTAVVWVKPSSIFKPDFVAQQLETDAWIVQPFETRDF